MKINNLKDLREERRMLRMEIQATEHLLMGTIRRTKHDAVSSIAGQILPAFTPATLISGASNLVGRSSGNRAKWLKVLLPMLPIALRLFNKDK